LEHEAVELAQIGNITSER